LFEFPFHEIVFKWHIRLIINYPQAILTRGHDIRSLVR
jgi:hypothetical protein